MLMETTKRFSWVKNNYYILRFYFKNEFNCEGMIWFMCISIAWVAVLESIFLPLFL